MKQSIRSAVVFAAISVLCTGCASGVRNAGAAVGPSSNARSFTPPPGKSGIYVIRGSSIVGAAAYWRIFLDVEPLAEIGNSSYVYATVDPGLHNIQVIYQTEEGTTLRTEAGKNYFFLMGISSTGQVTRVSEEEGRDYVNRFKGG